MAHFFCVNTFSYFSLSSCFFSSLAFLYYLTLLLIFSVIAGCHFQFSDPNSRTNRGSEQIGQGTYKQKSVYEKNRLAKFYFSNLFDRFISLLLISTFSVLPSLILQLCFILSILLYLLDSVCFSPYFSLYLCCSLPLFSIRSLFLCVLPHFYSPPFLHQ